MANEKEKSDLSSKPFLTAEEAQKAGIDLKLRNPDGSIINPLEDTDSPSPWLNRMLTRSISLITTLIDHPDPEIALAAADTVIARAVQLKEISQWSQTLLDGKENRLEKVLSYDRVGTDGNSFDRGGIGDDKMFSARLSKEDIEALEKIEGKGK